MAGTARLVPRKALNHRGQASYSSKKSWETSTDAVPTGHQGVEGWVGKILVFGALGTGTGAQSKSWCSEMALRAGAFRRTVGVRLPNLVSFDLPRWSVNLVSFVLPHTPYLISLKHNLLHAFDQTPAPETYPENYDIRTQADRAPNPNASYSDSIYRLKFNSTVDIIIQNANTLNLNNSETHPWHLHGHDFWVLGYGIGEFDPASDYGKLNLVDPIMKNTVPVFPYGWTVIRFRADNPGVWAFHCHIEAHFYLGMGVVFEEGIERTEKLPRQIMGCGESKKLLNP